MINCDNYHSNTGVKRVQILPHLPLKTIFLEKNVFLSQHVAKTKKPFLGHFHLVGVIFTLWGKIYCSDDKMKLYCDRFSFFLGKSDAMIYFQVEPQFPLKMKKLEIWWSIAIFNDRKGWSGFWGMQQGQATNIPTPLKPPTSPCNIPQNTDYPSRLLKIAIDPKSL